MNIEKVDTNKVQQAMQPEDQWDDFDVQERAPAGNVQPSDGPGEQPHVDGREALAGAEVRTLEEQLRAQVPARHSLLKTLAGWGRKAGRAFMMFCHAAYNFFSGAIPKMHRPDFEQAARMRTVTDGVVHVRTEQTSEAAYVLSDGTNVAHGDVVSYTNGEIGAAMGLDGPADVVPFDEDDVAQIANGDFHLEDIEQDPNLQNCWFLSSLASVLSFKGAQFLQNLITIPQVVNGGNQRADADFALVKMGINTYKVPLGDVVGAGGEKGTSSSKAWVRLLETAMQMHMVRLVQMDLQPPQGIGLKVDMHGGSPLLALGALLGLEEVRPVFQNDPGSPMQLDEKITIRRGQEGNGNLNDRLDTIQLALGGGKPVVLATSGDLGQSLKYGISPGHAVSVQGVEFDGDDNEPGHPYLHILDPYGRSVVMDADILLTGAQIFIGEEPEH